MTVMTERDKVLVSVLSVIVIIVVFLNYLVLPMYRKSEELKASIEMAVQQKEEMEEKIRSLPANQQTFDALRENFLSAAETYYPIMSTQEIDKEITNMVLDCGLESVGLRISVDKEPSPRTAFYASELAILGTTGQEEVQPETGTATERAVAGAEKAAEERAFGESSQEEAPAAMTENTEIYAAHVVLTVEGTEEDYQRIIDHVTNGFPALQVTGYSYQIRQGAVTYDEEGNLVSTGTVRTLNLNLDLYMCDKTFEQE